MATLSAVGRVFRLAKFSAFGYKGVGKTFASGDLKHLMTIQPTPDSDKPGSKLIGWVVFGSIAVGVVATIGGIAALAADTSDYMGGGMLMFAAACSFGLLANALLRR